MNSVLFVNCSDVGSTGKIICDTAEVLRKNGWESYLCVPRVFGGNHLPYKKVFILSKRIYQAISYRFSKICGNRYGKNNIATKKLERIIKKIKPTVVHLHCLNGEFVNIFKILVFLKRNNIPTVVTNHAEFYYTGNCDHAYACDKWISGCGKCPQCLSVIDRTAHYWKKMKKAFYDFPSLTVTSVSPWVKERCEKSGIMQGIRQVIVENGLNTEIFTYTDEGVFNDFGIETANKKVVLYVTACFSGESNAKGSKYLLRLAEKTINENILYLVAGDYLKGISVPDNIVLLGRVKDQTTLAKLYSNADLTLITSERETFSMPVAESLCCGTPVVGFKAGGPESIGIEKYSEFVDFGDVDKLKEAVADKLSNTLSPEQKRQLSIIAQGKYNKEKMGNEYLQIYRDVLVEHDITREK